MMAKRRGLVWWMIGGALVGALLLPFLVGSCGFLSLIFSPLPHPIRTPPGIIFRIISTLGGFSFFAAQGAVLGVLSAALWRGKRGFWLRFFAAMCGAAISGAWLWVIWSTYNSLPLALKFPIACVYLSCAAPLISWALALVFFAVLLRPAKPARDLSEGTMPLPS